MSKESKILIGVGGVAVIGLILAASGRLIIGLIVLAVALIGGLGVLRARKVDTSDPFAAIRSEADRSNMGQLTTPEPLAPWAPEGGLNAWTPPLQLEPPAPDPYADAYGAAPAPPDLPTRPEPPTTEPPTAEAPTAEPATTDWDNTAWENSATWDTAPSAPPETNPLDDLIGLDTLDPIAEVERIDNRSATLAALPTDTDASSDKTVADADLVVETDIPVINENVTDTDDIMAASQATELNLAEGEQTELQKLLAKVQMRLSAYE